MSSTTTQRATSTDNKSIYILYLEDDNYYVGASADLHNRILTHNKGSGAEWTKEHPVIAPLSIGPPIPNWKAVEKQVTLQLMKICGWKSVRGGPWTKVNLRRAPRSLRWFYLAPRTAASFFLGNVWVERNVTQRETTNIRYWSIE